METTVILQEKEIKELLSAALCSREIYIKPEQIVLDNDGDTTKVVLTLEIEKATAVGFYKP